MAGGEGLPEAHEPDEIVGLDDAAVRTPRAPDAPAGGAALLALDAPFSLPSPFEHDDADMVSCMSDSDDFDDMMSCVSEVLNDPSISGIDTAANGPAQMGDSGVDAPKVHVDPGDPAQFFAADAPPGGSRNEEATPMSAAALVRGISERFGLSAAHATLLSTAAAGCPNEGEHTPGGRVRGVFPLPFLCRRRHRASGTMRAGERRRAVHRDRVVSKTNLIVGHLNLLFGGRDCMTAAMETRAGAAQLSALSRVQSTVKAWNFTADVAEAEALAG